MQFELAYWWVNVLEMELSFMHYMSSTNNTMGLHGKGQFVDLLHQFQYLLNFYNLVTIVPEYLIVVSGRVFTAHIMDKIRSHAILVKQFWLRCNCNMHLNCFTKLLIYRCIATWPSVQTLEPAWYWRTYESMDRASIGPGNGLSPVWYQVTTLINTSNWESRNKYQWNYTTKWNKWKDNTFLFGCPCLKTMLKTEV